MLEIDMEFKKGILFVRLIGILNGDTCNKFEDDLFPLIKDNGIKYVLLNLEGLNYLDKYGINSIIKNYMYVSSNKGKLIIVGINKLFAYNTNIIDNLYQVNNESNVFNVVNI